MMEDEKRERSPGAGTRASHDDSPVPSELHKDTSASHDHNNDLTTPHDEEGRISSEKPAAPNPHAMPPPPDGGTLAWLHVLGGFMLFFNTWGLLNAFGVFQTYYETGHPFKTSPQNVAWIGSIQAYLVLTVGFVTGPLYDKGYLRALLCTGSFMVVFGHMMLSLSSTFWQALLAQGFCVGIGSGCLFVPCVAIIPTYFSKRLGMAIGLAASGSSFGGIIYPIVLSRLIPRIGFPWATRVLAFIALATLIAPCIILRQRVKPPKARELVDLSAFTDLHFMIFTLAGIVGFMGMTTFLFYVSFFSSATRILDTNMSFYIIAILNAASCLGRTLPNILADKTGPFNVIVPGAYMVGVIALCQLAVRTEADLIATVVFFGFFSGVFIALPPMCIFALTPDKSKLGTRMGMAFGIMSFGILIAGPGGGAILTSKGPQTLYWRGLWIFAGVAGLSCATVLGALRIMRAGLKVKVKV